MTPTHPKLGILFRLSRHIMISINRCKEILESPDLSDEQIIEVRDILYAVAEQFFDAEPTEYSRVADQDEITKITKNQNDKY